MKNTATFILLTLAILSACNTKSLDERYNFKTFQADLNVLNTRKLLSDSDKTLLLYYIAETSDSQSLAKSYGQLLSDAKEKKEKEKALKEQLTIKVSGKYIQQYTNANGNWKNYLIIEIATTNNSSRNIEGFDVSLNFMNPENQIFYSGEWNVDKTVAPHLTRVLPVNAGEYNNNVPDLVRLDGADLSKVKVDYLINSIVYDDGTALSLK